MEVGSFGSFYYFRVIISLLIQIIPVKYGNIMQPIPNIYVQCLSRLLKWGKNKNFFFCIRKTGNIRKDLKLGARGCGSLNSPLFNSQQFYNFILFYYQRSPMAVRERKFVFDTSEHHHFHENNSNLIRQMVQLAKQNHLLTIQLQTLKAEYGKLLLLKNKYKSKYTQLKDSFSSKNNLKAGRLVSPQPNNRSLSGRIYNQSSTGHIYQKSNYNASTNQALTSRSIDRISLQLKDHDQNLQQVENPYGVNQLMQKAKSVFAQQMSRQITKVVELINSLSGKKDNNQIEVKKVISRLDSLENTLASNLQQIKCQFNEMLEANNRKQFQFLKRKDEQYSDHLSSNRDNDLYVSGSNTPVKDKNLLSSKKNKKVALNYNSNYGSLRMEDKLSRSKSEKHVLFIKNNQKSSVQSKREIFENDNPKQKWQLLNEIGKKLENWKISNQDSQLLLNEDDQPKQTDKK